MKGVSLRKWDETPQNTDKLLLVTKLTDLGDPIANKSILGVYFNFRQEEVFDIESNAAHTIYVSYREFSEGNFKPFGTFIQINTRAQFGDVHKFVNTSPIEVKNIQLRVEGSALGKFSINDFGLLFRVHRENSTKSLDED